MKPRVVDLTPKQRMLHLVVERPHKPAVGGGIIAWLVAAIGVVLGCLVLASGAYGTEAPGCGQQSLRPRLSQCCPRFLAGEWLPPKCTRALTTGFLAKCCGGPTPVPTPTPEPTCPEGWTCWPTPYPTSTYAIVGEKSLEDVGLVENEVSA